eukprot:CAMPEP_0173077670 /NCGR_PEP_ID=MMETSP1102-20130122/13454_1 /TAXON_ID=49646 /ORGANISM="Geminigera sp., Strain Caron Lab Isolate" /LENGTH=216 /DNA_ID=CAMNT_0013948381 /DNA_START=139 /DNA_END=786 /DNA_ORIENTATION=+
MAPVRVARGGRVRPVRFLPALVRAPSIFQEIVRGTARARWAGRASVKPRLGAQIASGFLSQQRGECVVARQPPCCGAEPLCEITPQSPFPCISRDPDFIPAHNVSATCVCADTYVGIDCGDTIAGQIIRKEQLSALAAGDGCFAIDSQVHLVRTSLHPPHAHARRLGAVRISDVEIGDVVRSVDAAGRDSATTVVFVHDHVLPSATVVLHFVGAAG